MIRDLSFVRLGFVSFKEFKMKASVQTVSWKLLFIISFWMEMFCVDSRPFFLGQNRPIVPGPDIFESKPTVDSVQAIFELTKTWVDPDEHNLNKTQLLERLGSHFDSFYMSVEPPKSSRRKNGMSISMRSASIERKNSAMSKMPQRIRQLQFEITRGDRKRSRVLGYRASTKLRQWLWELSRCPINYSWVDHGVKVFPRYIRYGRCIEKPCSFPRGMNCQPKSTKELRLLIWICPPNSMCTWYPFSLTVNESCQCSCRKGSV